MEPKTLGLATGSSPLEFYQRMTESDLDFSNLVSVNLDEYVGLTGEDPQSYRYFMQENLFNKKPFKISYLPKEMKRQPKRKPLITMTFWPKTQ